MKAKFGPGGNSEAFKSAGFFSTVDAPMWLSSIGLDAYEYEAGNGLAASVPTLAVNAQVTEDRFDGTKVYEKETRSIASGTWVHSPISFTLTGTMTAAFRQFEYSLDQGNTWHPVKNTINTAIVWIGI